MSATSSAQKLLIRTPSRQPLAPLPRLRVHHFLLWTAATALWLALARSFGVLESTVQERASIQLHALVLALLWGAVTATAGLGVYWRAKGLAFFTQPGQWLIVWSMLSILWQVISSLLFMWA